MIHENWTGRCACCYALVVFDDVDGWMHVVREGAPGAYTCVRACGNGYGRAMVDPTSVDW